MTDTTATPVTEKPTAAPGAPAPTATEKLAPTTAAGDLLELDHDTDDDAGGEGGEAAPQTEGEPAEKPAWARPDDPEAAEAWREERNVPLEPDDYELPIADPDHLDDTAQQTIEGFKEVAHKFDLPQEATASMYEYAANRAQEIMAARVEQDRTEAAATKQALAEQWGDRANDNLKSVHGLLKTLPTGLSKAVREARTGNGLGSKLANDPAFLAMLADYAALKDGGPSVGVFDGQADDARIKAIELTRRNNIDEYFRQDMHLEIEKLMVRKAARAPAAEGPRPGDRARETEIRKVLAKDYGQFRDQKLDVELSQILQRRGAQQ